MQQVQHQVMSRVLLDLNINYRFIIILFFYYLFVIFFIFQWIMSKFVYNIMEPSSSWLLYVESVLVSHDIVPQLLDRIFYFHAELWYLSRCRLKVEARVKPHCRLRRSGNSLRRRRSRNWPILWSSISSSNHYKQLLKVNHFIHLFLFFIPTRRVKHVMAVDIFFYWVALKFFI